MAGVPARRIGWMSKAGAHSAPDLVCPSTAAATGRRRMAASRPSERARSGWLPKAPAAIEFIDLKAQQARIRVRLDAAIARVLDHGQYIMGPEVSELEERLATFAGAKYAISCSSGTDALLIAMMAKGIGPAPCCALSSLYLYRDAGDNCAPGRDARVRRRAL